jgi:hypothetical protein
MYRTGSVAGVTGHTIFLLEGKNHRGTYRNKFILNHNAEIGSTTIMAPTAFMPEYAWENATPNIIEGFKEY